MNRRSAQSIIPGIHLDASGQATVDAPLGERLIELAIELEAYTDRPVDVQHVLAAIILAAGQGELSADEPLPRTDACLCGILARHVNAVFERYGGRVAPED